uniref:Zn(2)-C6 fungal-type domain-containing protein n=1 Tax=Guillardia theta TaxID=55529 RepID=A0A7S4JLC5_GUITH|mmetsp:Transcript_17294/g.57218  ORF Transcript_17294/g.57218 Transcript_17294/m.57218 type:complete len:448 (+) Transcript_17294:51-1394(+)
MSAAVGAKRHADDYDEWCDQMAAKLSSVNRHAAQSLAVNLIEGSHSVRQAHEVESNIDHRPRNKRSKYTRKSCAECKLKKRKCSQERPCVMCIMAGTSHKCLTECNVSLSTSIFDAREAYFPDAFAQEASLRALKDTCAFSGVNISLVRPLWELGFDVSMLFRAFKLLPLDLKVAVDELVELIREGLTKSSIQNPAYQALLTHQSGLGRVSRFQQNERAKMLETFNAGAYEEDIACFDTIASNDRWGHGRWLSVEFDSNLNCKRLRIGDEMSDLFGCHHTEILSRFFCHDLVNSMSEYELLVAWVSSILCSFNAQSIFYIKVERRGGPEQEKRMLYLKCFLEKSWNHAGIHSGYTIVFESASPESYHLYKNRFLPPSMQQHDPEKAAKRVAIARESIVFMRKSITVGEDRLSHLASVIKHCMADVRTHHPLFVNEGAGHCASIELMV